MSEQLRQARINAGLSLQQVVTRAGIARGTMERAERGKEPISPVTASRIVNALNALAGTSYTPESLNMFVSD